MKKPVDKDRGGLIIWIGIVLVAVVGLWSNRTTIEAKPPTRVEAYAVTDERAEVAAQALQGLLANEWTIDSMQAMFVHLHGPPQNYTDASVDAWAKMYYASEAVHYAIALEQYLGYANAAYTDALEAAGDDLMLKAAPAAHWNPIWQLKDD